MKKIFGVAAITIVVFIAICLYQNYLLEKGFETTKSGDKESQVISRMGKPSKVVFLGDKEFWSSHVAGSIKEYQYNARILPEIWVIGFDSNDMAVYRNHNIM